MGPILGAEFLVAVGDICAFSSADRGSLPRQVLCLRPVTPASGSATTKGCEEETRFSRRGSSTSRPLPACAALRNPGLSTIARGLRVRGTPTRWLHPPAGGSMFCGRCCATEPRSRAALRLDIFIEILPNLALKCATHSETDAVGGADLGLRRPPSAVPLPHDGRGRRSLRH
jgi:hypothetical protein